MLHAGRLGREKQGGRRLAYRLHLFIQGCDPDRVRASQTVAWSGYGTSRGTLVVPDVREESQRIAMLRDRARRVAVGTVDREQQRLDQCTSRPVLASPQVLVSVRRTEVEGVRDRARRCATAQLDRAQQELTHTRAQVLALSPQATLDRGYAVVQTPDGTVVRDAAEVVFGESLRVRLAAGELRVTAS